MFLTNIFGPFGHRNVWNEMKHLRDEMNRLFGTFFVEPSGSAFPSINIWAGKDDAILTSEIPGIDPDDLAISVAEDTFTLSGDRPLEEGTSEGEYHRKERALGRFSRTIQLPFRVDGSKVDATYNQGILRVHLPRLEEDKPKQISIKVS